MSSRFALGMALALGLVGASAWAKPAPRVTLATEGKTQLKVVVSESASERVRQAAATLAEYLTKISGAAFEVQTGSGLQGIAVGVLADFPNLDRRPAWREGEPTQRENYLLRSHANGLYVIGATEAGVDHAVWDLLYRLGHRQFFPGPVWEIIPRQPNLAIAVDVQEHPDYLARRIWYGFGAWDYAVQPYSEWCARNRAVSGIELRTGHAYDGIISRNKAEFARHPEYLGLVDGERKSTKFCIANPGLRKLVVADALAQRERDPSAESLSVDPSDGLGWCECEDCRALGSISDRALMLANEVAEAVNQKQPGVFVGMYAYSAHSPPPTLRVHPQAVISVATAFIRGGYTVEELMEGWSKRGATLGIREYFSVNTWDRDLPGRSRGSDLAYLRRTIPHYHRLGARFFSAESSDNWGPNGLGYYLAARMLWDVDEAERVDALVEDFLDRAFGAAREPMAEFYRLLDGAAEPLLSDDLVGRMYRHLAEARAQTDDPAVHRRLDDLTLYARYVEFWSDYANAKGEARQAAFEQLIRHVYRMRKTMMVHAKALYRDVAARDKTIRIPEGATWNVPEERNPWKSSEPFSDDELARMIQEGVANRPLRGFDDVAFSTNLVPASRLNLPSVKPGSMGLYSRGVCTWYTWVQAPALPIRLTVRGGRIYKDRGEVKITLHRASASDATPLASATAAPDGQERSIELPAPEPGLYRVTLSDGGAGTEVAWPEDQPMTVLSGDAQRAEFHGRWSLYFYVPKGTKMVGGYASGPGRLLDSQGNVLHTFEETPGYFRVKPPPGEDGQLWKFDHCAGQRLLLTVPPSLARSARELLLPAEVVQRDGTP